MMDRAVRRKKLGGLIHAHAEHLADALAFELNSQRLGREALSATSLASDFYVGQEAHLDGLHALTFARFATSTRGVEREAAGFISAHARFARVGEHLADGIEETDVGRRTRARRLADRRLIDFEHA